MKKICDVLLIVLVFFNGNLIGKDKTSLINTSHLDHLYEEIKMNGEKVGIIHIYSEYPDYKWIGDEDEGIACVDDGARASVFYLKHYQLTGQQKDLEKAKNLIKFVLKMQSGNGFFFNFIWPDHTINKTFRTSVAEPNWWSWRALWALSEAALYYRDVDQSFYNTIMPALQKGIDSARTWLIKDNEYKEYGGFSLPAWLPYETASDQAAVLVKTMLTYFEASGDSSVIDPVKKLCDGIMLMQAGDSSTIPYYAFLSWQNTWHAWGNSQSDALIMAGKILLQRKFVEHAFKEIKYFYPFLIKEKFYSDFVMEKDSVRNEMIKSSKFSQIAYGIRPIVFACISAYEITEDPLYAKTAVEAAGWFFGKNIVRKNMYDIESGRGYDGIQSEEKINFNSGAESTIETLLSILRIEQNAKAKAMLENLIREK